MGGFFFLVVGGSAGSLDLDIKFFEHFCKKVTYFWIGRFLREHAPPKIFGEILE
jgi:hypothetical protein